jgi:hypothetical protein
MGDAFVIGAVVIGVVLLLAAFLYACGYRFDRLRGMPEPIDLATARTVREGDALVRRIVYGTSTSRAIPVEQHPAMRRSSGVVAAAATPDQPVLRN